MKSTYFQRQNKMIAKKTRQQTSWLRLVWCMQHGTFYKSCRILLLSSMCLLMVVVLLHVMHKLSSTNWTCKFFLRNTLSDVLFECVWVAVLVTTFVTFQVFFPCEESCVCSNWTFTEWFATCFAPETCIDSTDYNILFFGTVVLSFAFHSTR